MERIFEGLRESVSEACFEDIVSMVEEYISEVSKDWLESKEEHARNEKNRMIGKHGLTMTPENPEGDPKLAQKRRAAIERIKKFRKRKAEYLENKAKKEGK